MLLSWFNSWNNYLLLANTVNLNHLQGRCLEVATRAEHGSSVPSGGKRAGCAGPYLLCCTHHSRTSRWAHSPSQASLRSSSQPWSCVDTGEERDADSGSWGQRCDRFRDPAFCLSPKCHHTHFRSCLGFRVRVTWVLWSVWSSLWADARLWQCVQPSSTSSRLRGLNSLSSRQPRLRKSSSFNRVSAVTWKPKEAARGSSGDLLLIRVRSFSV